MIHDTTPLNSCQPTQINNKAGGRQDGGNEQRGRELDQNCKIGHHPKRDQISTKRINGWNAVRKDGNESRREEPPAGKMDKGSTIKHLLW